MASLVFISFIFYTFSALLYLSHFIFQKRILLKLAQRFVLFGFLSQAAGLILHGIQVGYPFLLESSDSYFFSAFILAGIFLLVCLKYPLEPLGLLISPAVLILDILGLFSSEDYSSSVGFFSSPWASIHIVFSFLSLSVFLLAFVMGLLFLIQEFQLKWKKIFRIFRSLPPMTLLEKLHTRTLGVGFILLTLGIISGAAWAKSVKGVYFFDDPKQLWAILAWLVYAFFFQTRYSVGWKGRRGVLLSILGFLVILFTFFEVRHA